MPRRNKEAHDSTGRIVPQDGVIPGIKDGRDGNGVPATLTSVLNELTQGKSIGIVGRVYEDARREEEANTTILVSPEYGYSVREPDKLSKLAYDLLPGVDTNSVRMQEVVRGHTFNGADSVNSHWEPPRISFRDGVRNVTVMLFPNTRIAALYQFLKEGVILKEGIEPDDHFIQDLERLDEGRITERLFNQSNSGEDVMDVYGKYIRFKKPHELPKFMTSPLEDAQKPGVSAQVIQSLEAAKGIENDYISTAKLDWLTRPHTPERTTEIWSTLWQIMSNSLSERIKVTKCPFTSEQIKSLEQQGKMIVYIPPSLSGIDAIGKIASLFPPSKKVHVNPDIGGVFFNVHQQSGWLAIDGKPRFNEDASNSEKQDDKELLADHVHGPTINTYLISSLFSCLLNGEYFDEDLGETGSERAHMPLFGTIQKSRGHEGYGNWKHASVFFWKWRDEIDIYPESNSDKTALNIRRVTPASLQLTPEGKRFLRRIKQHEHYEGIEPTRDRVLDILRNNSLLNVIDSRNKMEGSSEGAQITVTTKNGVLQLDDLNEQLLDMFPGIDVSQIRFREGDINKFEEKEQPFFIKYVLPTAHFTEKLLSGKSRYVAIILYPYQYLADLDKLYAPRRIGDSMKYDHTSTRGDLEQLDGAMHSRLYTRWLKGENLLYLYRTELPRGIDSKKGERSAPQFIQRTEDSGDQELTADQFRLKRERLGLTRSEAARRLGVNIIVIDGVETGIYPVSRNIFERLSKD